MIKLVCDDCKEALKDLENNSVDSVVTDPPYELGFMGKAWDKSGIAYNVDLWREVLRVLKPGGYLLAFGGTRTYHRMACAIEDAGFEIRDQIQWIYGSGFPKSLDVGKVISKLNGEERKIVGKDKSGSKRNCMAGDFTGGEYNLTKGTSEWEGFGTALKPANEPICLARKPLSDGGVDNVKTFSYLCKENDFNKEIKWRIKRVNPVEKQKKLKTLSLTEQQKTVEVSVRTVSERETQNIGKEIGNLLESLQEDGEMIIYKKQEPRVQNIMEQISKGFSNIKNIIIKSCEQKLYHNMEESVNVAGSQYKNFLPLTILTEAEQNIEKVLKTETYFNSLNKTDTLKTNTDCCVGTATSQWQNMEVAHIRRINHQNKEYEFIELIDGSFVWNNQITPFISPKPLTVAENVLKWGTGGINIDGCRVKTEIPQKKWEKPRGGIWITDSETTSELIDNQKGRWPANIIHDGSDEVLQYFPDTKSGFMKRGTPRLMSDNPNKNCYGYFNPDTVENDTYGDLGSASRFFYTAKAAKSERNFGLDEFSDKLIAGGNQAQAELKRGNIEFKSDNEHHSGYSDVRKVKNNHPTVKPVELMRYLCRLITPPKGIILDPFMGSGSTGIGAKLEGFSFIGIEKEEEYCKIAEARIDAWKPEGKTNKKFNNIQRSKSSPDKEDQPSFF